jgi:hypothetical protein
MVVSQAAEFVVNQRQQATKRLFVTGPPVGEQLTDWLGFGGWHSGTAEKRNSFNGRYRLYCRKSTY